jgi:hypothetical protein
VAVPRAGFRSAASLLLVFATAPVCQYATPVPAFFFLPAATQLPLAWTTLTRGRMVRGAPARPPRTPVVEGPRTEHELLGDEVVADVSVLME